jgi:hypothetical protein
VELIAEKLRPVQVVFDLDAIADPNAAPDMQRRKRLMKLLIEKEEKTESLAAVRRSVYLLAEINNGPATALLQEFASGSQAEMSALAAEALEYLE